MTTQRHDSHIRQYDNLLRSILTKGENVMERSGEGARKLFGHAMRFDVSETIPLLTGKAVACKYTYYELLWFISGSTLLNDLDPRVRHWWSKWVKNQDTSDLGPIYGKQLRAHGAGQVDQLAQLIDGIKNNPMSRRHIVTTWDPSSIPDMGLPPCHGLVIQLGVSPRGRLDMCMTQRSADAFIGLPVNMLSYTMLLYMIAHVCNLKPGTLTMFLGDVHIYTPHMEGVREYLDRRPAEQSPTLAINKEVTSLFSFSPDDVVVENYEPMPQIKAALLG